MSLLSTVALWLVILTRYFFKNLSDAVCKAIKKVHKILGSFSPFLEFLSLHRRPDTVSLKVICLLNKGVL